MPCLTLHASYCVDIPGANLSLLYHLFAYNLMISMLLTQTVDKVSNHLLNISTSLPPKYCECNFETKLSVSQKRNRKKEQKQGIHNGSSLNMLCLFFLNLPTVCILRSLGGLPDALLSSDLNRANHYSLLILSSAKFLHPYVFLTLPPWPYSAFLIHHLDEVCCKIKSLIRLPVSNLDHSELSFSCRHTGQAQWQI